ncbi:helix-turn-helix transcriptional regulator [Bifidobacterium sp. MA2]|uniref:Helix-turn-helix transcriptional regulator n=1 Tax=Bifidobacterium santillanense TaxID=2809028 RepID=A0ABS5US07_9BIFI|nr:helix-turn-helix transcriptional regulator [Bifidobacterium santillanense]MBT1173784.1 helix-turn-helix transcriptional regulator [Bifidobacterium santillanense]
MTFRTNLQTLRAKRNMTQEQLAMLLGVSRQAISKWESEKAYPEMDKLLAICDLFGCTLDDLVLGDVNRPGSVTSASTDGESAVPADGASIPTGMPASGAPAKGVSPTSAPATALPKDITGYDAHRLRFSMLIASGVSTIIASVGIANLFDSERSIIGPNPLNDFLMFVCICVGVVVGLALLIPGGMAHVAFRRRHPYVEDFYTEDDRGREARVLTVGVIAGVAAILVGIAIVVYMDEVRGIGAGWPNAVMLLLSAAAVFGFVYGGLRYGMLDIARYNKETRIERGKRDGDLPFSERLSGAVSGIIMLVATIIGLTLLFLDVGHRFFWIPWPIGGLLCGVVSVVVWLFRDRLDR